MYHSNCFLVEVLPKSVLFLQLRLQRHVSLHLLLHILHDFLVIHFEFFHFEHKHLKAFSNQDLLLEWVRRVVLVIESEAGPASVVLQSHRKKYDLLVVRIYRPAVPQRHLEVLGGNSCALQEDVGWQGLAILQLFVRVAIAHAFHTNALPPVLDPLRAHERTFEKEHCLIEEAQRMRRSGRNMVLAVAGLESIAPPDLGRLQDIKDHAGIRAQSLQVLRVPVHTRTLQVLLKVGLDRKKPQYQLSGWIIRIAESLFYKNVTTPRRLLRLHFQRPLQI